jgi:predicted lipoprotein with Yx(FWY)xxD motif
MTVPTRTSRLPGRLLALAAVAALTLAACGDDDDDDAGTAAATADASAATTAAAAVATTAPAATEASGRDDIYGAEGSDTAGTTAAPAAGGGELGVATTDLGDIVVDSAGMSLYMFMPDNAGAPTCAADCAKAWPPLTGEASAGDGVDAGLIGTAEHPESGTQVTYNGWPLYYFAGDSAPGDTNGQGQGGVWYVIDATGNPIDSD